jgi:V8-like Glu-specific endopeptidase
MRLTLPLAFLVACLPALAEDRTAQMTTDAQAQLYAGVARMNVAGMRFCNAVLISETEAVTAAHCLFNQSTLHRARLQDIKLVFGFRRDTHAALRGVAALAVLPGFAPAIGGHATEEAIRNDLALLKLDAPVTTDVARPFPVAAWIGGDPVAILGYGQDRPTMLSIRAGCLFAVRDDEIAFLDCQAVPGLYGAAVIGTAAAGEMAPLFAVVAATRGAKIDSAMVVRIGPHLDELRAALQ